MIILVIMRCWYSNEIAGQAGNDGHVIPDLIGNLTPNVIPDLTPNVIIDLTPNVIPDLIGDLKP